MRDLRGINAGVHAAVLAYLDRAIVMMAKGRADTLASRGTGVASHDVKRILDHLLPQVGTKVSSAFSAMNGKVQKAYISSMKGILPIGLGQLPAHVQMIAQVRREQSIELVTNAQRIYASQVADVFNDFEGTAGLRWEGLADELRAKIGERSDVSNSRIELIARDQTLKLNGAINQAHQQGLGIESYTWSTSNDERVREEHAELEGQTFSWNAPPEPGNPGEDYQCRCIAIPNIGGSDDNPFDD